MDDKEFQAIMGSLAQYLEMPKAFVPNPERLAEVQRATVIANRLFADMTVSVKDDPIQMGALILCIEGFDIVVRGKEEIELFTALIAKADNFEIYPVNGESIKVSIVFSKVFTRVPTNNKKYQ